MSASPSEVGDVLLTGFEPFGGESVNPSQQIAEALHGKNVGRHRVESVVLPVSFERAHGALSSAMERVAPRLVLCLGQAGGEQSVCVERVAINIQDARMPDNDGLQPRGLSITEAGPVAYWSTLSVFDVERAIEAEDIPVRISNSAGTFVCNDVFYRVMHALSARPETRGGFVHLPFLPEQAPNRTSPTMPLETMIRATRIVIEESLGSR